MFYLLNDSLGSVLNWKHILIFFKVCEYVFYLYVIMGYQYKKIFIQLCLVNSSGKIIAWVDYFVQIMNAASS